MSLKNIFVNYDAPGPPGRVPDRTRLLEAFRPGQNDTLAEFDRLVAEALRRANVEPPRPVVVLLDTSGSMGDDHVYKEDTHAAFWRWFQAHGRPTVHRFTYKLDDDPLVPDALRDDWTVLTCAGGTDLREAVRTVVGRYGNRVRILAVTDLAPLEGLDGETIYWKPSAGSPEDVWRD